jgi:hypothetical protein
MITDIQAFDMNAQLSLMIRPTSAVRKSDLHCGFTGAALTADQSLQLHPFVRRELLSGFNGLAISRTASHGKTSNAEDGTPLTITGLSATCQRGYDIVDFRHHMPPLLQLRTVSPNSV